MKILIVIPSRAYQTVPGYADFPDEMLYAAAALEQRGHVVGFIDYNVSKGSPDVKPDAATRLIVFFVGMGPEIADALAKSRLFKSSHPAVKIVWCGCHPTALGGQTLDEPAIDFIIAGAAEHALGELADGVEKDSDCHYIAGLGYKSISTGNVINPPQIEPGIKDFFDPAWHLVDFADYPDVSLNTSRGCDYACTFFPETAAGSDTCLQPPDKLVDQMATVVSRYKAKHVYLSGHQFAVNLDAFKAFCRTLLSRKMKISWSVPVTGALDEESAALMTRAGCRSVLLDVGSASQRLRALLGKTELSQTEKTFHLLVKRGIIPTLLINYALPAETAAEFEETLSFIERLDRPPYLFLKYAPYPGTRSFDYCREQGLVEPPQRIDDWADFYYRNLSVANYSRVPQQMIDEALADYRKSYATRRVRFMARHHPAYFVSAITKPKEFLRRAKELARYLSEATER